MSVRPGDIITMSSFNHVQPTLKAGFKAPHGRLAVFLLLGDVDKKDPDSFDAGAALRAIGWYPESDFGPAEPGAGSIKDRAAELAASMKVMAALHRANEDVAAADEFAQGAELVATMAAEIELLTVNRGFLLADLIEAAATLRHYETMHRAKGTEESTAKAEVNAELATRFESTIKAVNP